MKATELQQHTEEIVATIDFAWTMIKPELLQTFHSLALQSIPATMGMAPPLLDTPVTAVDMGISLRPSEMQKHLVTAVVPTVLAGLQSIAEETLNNHFGDTSTIAGRLRNLRKNNVINAGLASEAHFWRVVRNVLIHGSGRITQSIESEAQQLRSKGEIGFSEFSLWGPLLEAGRGIPVPITPAARTPPYVPGTTAKRTPIIAGRRIEAGLGDVLAAGSMWAQILAKAT